MAIDPDIQPFLSLLSESIVELRNSTNNDIERVSREIQEMQDRIAYLEEQIVVKPPVSTQKTAFGYTRSALDAKVGLTKPGIVRDFTPGTSPSVTKMKNTLDLGIPLWYSWKPNLLSSTWINNVENALRQAVTTDSPPLYITVWHEPEGATDAGGGAPDVKAARWRDAQTKLHKIALKMRAEGLKVFVAPVICDWTFWETSKGGATTHWYPKDWTDYDVMGFDVYPQGQTKAGGMFIARINQTGSDTPRPYADPVRNDVYKAVRLCAGWAKECGKPWGSAETGIADGSVDGADVLYPYSRTTRANRFKEIFEDLISLDHAPLLWAWYNDNDSNITNAPDMESVAVWNLSMKNNPNL